MIVVADTSPLNYLIQLGQADLLSLQYQVTLIPSAVLAELSATGTPSDVRAWMAASPSWLKVEDAKVFDPAIALELDEGERKAIHLALERRCPLVIDEFKGREVAKSLGIPIVGTLGILLQGARLGRLEIVSALDKLGSLGFHLGERTKEETLRLSKMYLY